MSGPDGWTATLVERGTELAAYWRRHGRGMQGRRKLVFIDAAERADRAVDALTRATDTTRPAAEATLAAVLAYGVDWPYRDGEPVPVETVMS